jgi:hypothetical protein
MPKEKVSFRIDAEVMAVVRARAVGEGRSVSLVVNDWLKGISNEVVTPADGFEVVLPALNAGVHQAVQKSVDGLNSRLKHLLSRAMVSGLANRLAVFQLLASEFGQENARRIYDEATLEAERRLAPILKRLEGKLESADASPLEGV